jgi:hypothetical protein
MFAGGSGRHIQDMQLANDCAVSSERLEQPFNGWLEHGSKNDYPLTAENFQHLLQNRIPYIRINLFADVEECESLITAAAIHAGFNPYRNVEPRIDRIGNTVFEYSQISEDSYFLNNAEAARIQDRIFSDSFDPVARMMLRLHSLTGHPARRATRASGAPYYAGLIRRIEQGTLLHVDFAPAEQRTWDVAHVQCQLAWNLYLRTSGEDEGRTHVYERQWQPEDDAHREGSYGFSRQLVDGSRQADFLPRVGEVVIFNTRNFHYVDVTRGERVTVTSAIGNLPHGEIVLWS